MHMGAQGGRSVTSATGCEDNPPSIDKTALSSMLHLVTLHHVTLHQYYL